MSRQITGTHINYYHICKRKLWLFSHDITMEHTSDLVYIGSLLDQNKFSRKVHEIELDGIKLDYYEKSRKIVSEIKKSAAFSDAHRWQLKYYLYYFKKSGFELSGEIHFLENKTKEAIELTIEDYEYLDKIQAEIIQIIETEIPPIVKKIRGCKKCSYYEFCFIE